MPFPACTAENAIRSSIRFTPGPVANGFREALLEALARPTELWFPELAGPITASAWRKYGKCGFDATNYGTHRWLNGDPTAERREMAKLDLGNAFECRIERLPALTCARYENCGLTFSESVFLADDVTAIQSALSLVALIPSLRETVSAYLRSLHILRASGPDFDVSHSDPEVPFSIFVSIPPSHPEAKLRLAESIVHECMHLQLTMIEAVMPLVRNQDVQAYSPWRQTVRPLSGILHGLYVVSVIYSWFRSLDANLGPVAKKFVLQRKRDIEREFVQVAWLAASEGLTDAGKALARQALRPSNNLFSV